MRKIRKLLSFCLAIFIIFTNIAPAFADDSEQYDSDIFSEYEDYYEKDQDSNESDQDSNSDIEEISNYEDRSQEDDVIQIKIKNQQRPKGYVKLSFVGSYYVKPKTERAYYIKRGSGIKLGDPRIEKPDVIERVGYKFRGWDKDDETIIDAADIVVTSRSVVLDNVIDNTDGSKEKPKGYVEVKFSSEDESKLFLVPKGRVLYVNPTKKVNLLNFLPLVHRLEGAPSNKISYIWSKNIEAIRRYCHDIEIKAKWYEDKYKISEKEYQDKIKYWENVIENNKNNERLKKYGEEHLKATKEKYKKVSLIMEHGTFYPYSEKDENFTKLVYYVEKDRPVSFDVMNILPDTGYEFLGWSSDIKARKRYREDTEIRAIFNKIPDIIPETSSDGFKLDKEDGYVEVEFKKADHITLEGETKYFVNPNAGVKISDIPEPTVKVDEGYTFDTFETQDGEEDQIITQDTYLEPIVEEDPDSPGEINTDSKPPIPAYDPPCPIDQEEPDELPVEETKVLASAKFHGLKGKKFEFQKIYPQGLSLELKGQIKLDNNQTEDLSEEQVLLNPTTRRGKVTGTFDFGMVNKAFFIVANTGEKYADLYFNQSQTDFGKILEKHTPPIINNEEKTTTYPVDFYQTQNTYLKFNTLDKDNNPVENPTFGTFTYKIGDEVGNSLKNIPQSKEKFDAYKENYVNLDNMGKFNGTNKPEISLDKANEGGFIYKSNDDFAYKILKTKQDSLLDPLEVTLVRKQKVIKGGFHPKCKDPESGKEIDDPDYVKVDFKAGENTSIIGKNPVYWVLKDVDLDGKVKAPKVKTSTGYISKWKPELKTTKQKYKEDTSHISQSTENKMKVIAKVNLHGLKGKDFEFSKFYPNGAELELKGEITDKNNQKQVLSKKIKFDQNNLNIDFGNYPESFFINPNNTGNKLPDINLISKALDFGKIFIHQDAPFVDDETKTVTYNIDVYQTQNTYVSFNTVDKDNNKVANPKFGTYKYVIGFIHAAGRRKIPISDEKFDSYDDKYVNFDNKENFDGTNKPNVFFMQGEKENFIYDDNDDFAYKILKTRQKSLSDPLEVTLIRKQKVIKGGSRPKCKDPESGKEIDDPDYVKVDFKAGDHTSIVGENPVYWVLKDVKVRGEIKYPEVIVDGIYGVPYIWNPLIYDKYEKDQTHIAKFNNYHPNPNDYDNKIEPVPMISVLLKVRLHYIKDYYSSKYNSHFNAVVRAKAKDKYHNTIRFFVDEFKRFYPEENHIVYVSQIPKEFFLYPDDTEKKFDYLRIYPNESREYRGRTLVQYSGKPDIDFEKRTATYNIDVYMTQNTYLSFNTVDKDNREISNPTFAKFTYKIGDEIGNRNKSIPSSKERFDAYKDEYINLDNKEKFNRTIKPEISLDKASPSGFVSRANDDFAYKILKTKQDSLSDPLDVTLIKKQKVIKGNERPKIKDERGNYIPDTDYVKVDFKAGEHSTIEGENPVYWVLKDVDLDGEIKAPKVKVDEGYSLSGWKPVFKTTNQRYKEDTSHISKIVPKTINIIAKVKLHGLNGKEFETKKLYPNGMYFELKGKVKDEDDEIYDLLGKKLVIDPTSLEGRKSVLGVFFAGDSLDGLKNFEYLHIKQPSSYMGKIFQHHNPPKIDWNSQTATYNVDLYQTQSTYLSFNTIDKDRNETENPTFGKFTYKIGNVFGDAVKNIPQSKEKFDAFDADFVNFDRKGKFDGTNKPEISLEEPTDSGFIYNSNDDDFAYKILKTKQDSLSDPLEVTLVKKQKVIEGNDRPTIKDESGKYIPDDDYVKVDFKTGAHSKIEGDNPVYWVLKDVNLGSKIKAPKVKITDYGYGFKGWKPWYEAENQKYSKDMSHEAIIDKIKYFDYLTYAGDTTTNSLQFRDPSRLYLIGLVDEYGIYKEKQLKSYVDFENIPKKARVTLPYGVIKDWGKKELEVSFQMRVDNSFGDDILQSPTKQLERETMLFVNDKFGNANWFGIRYTIRNQNTKGNVKPQEKETFKNVDLSKEEIYDAVKNGEFTYRDSVKPQNKSGQNALHREVNGKNLLNPDKVKKFEITDEDYKKIDFSRIGQQEVPVTITYLDNSKSEVKVKINIKENVPTGLNEQTKHTQKIILALGTIGILVSVLNIKKKFLKI